MKKQDLRTHHVLTAAGDAETKSGVALYHMGTVMMYLFSVLDSIGQRQYTASCCHISWRFEAVQIAKHDKPITAFPRPKRKRLVGVRAREAGDWLAASN